jgi:HK97 family phage portal protein
MDGLPRQPGGRGLNLIQKALWYVSGRPKLSTVEHWPRDNSYAGVAVSETSVLALSAAWACVNLLAGTIASLPLMVYRTDDDGNRVVAKDHPLYRILHDSPNAEQTAMDFWEGGNAALELKGGLHAYIDRIGSRIVALTPINEPTVRRMESGELRYRWVENGQQRDEPESNVFHVRGFMGGMSAISAGRQVFGLASAVNVAAQTTFANGMRPSGVLTVPGVLKAEQREPLEKALGDKFVGSINAGRPMLLEAGVTWQPLTINPEDAQMLESRAFSVEEVARLFGVPPHMIGHTEKSTSWGTGLEQQTLGFVKFTLRKRLKRIEQAIEKQLLTPSDRASGVTVEFNLEGLLRGDSIGRAAFYKSGLGDGWLNINQVCKWENLPPVEGGDVNRVQMQNVPITEAGKEPETTAPGGNE